MSPLVRFTARWELHALLIGGLLGALTPAAHAQLEEKLDALTAELGNLYDGSPATLEECIRVAEVGSAQLGSLEEDVRNAQTDRRASLSAFFPDLTASASWSRSQRTDKDVVVTDELSGLSPAVFSDSLGNDLPLTIGGQPAYFQTAEEIPISVEDQTTLQTFENQSLRSALIIFSGFSRIAERKRSKVALLASESNLAYQRELLVQEVSNAYYDLIGAKARVRVAEDSEQLALRELERSETYFELGISTRADVLQAKVQHQNTQLDLVRERNAERNAFARLAHIMNIPQAERFEIVEGLPDIRLYQIPEPSELIVQASTQRQDLEASRLNLDAQGHSVTIARSGYYPQLEVFGQLQRSVNRTPVGFRFGGEVNHSIVWGISGSWNIFDRFRTQQQSRRAVAERRKAEYNVRQAQLDMELEIVQLVNNLRDSLELFEVATVSVEQSIEDLRLAEERFRVGAGTALDVIVAQVNLAAARRDEVDAQIGFLKFRRQLERATGGALD